MSSGRLFFVGARDGLTASVDRARGGRTVERIWVGGWRPSHYRWQGPQKVAGALRSLLLFVCEKHDDRFQANRS